MMSVIIAVSHYLPILFVSYDITFVQYPKLQKAKA